MRPGGVRGIPLPVQATVLAAVGLILLVPTFNALNAASFEAREPPFDLSRGDGPGFDRHDDGDIDVDVIPDEDGWTVSGSCPATVERHVWGDADAFGGGLPAVGLLGEETGRVRIDAPLNTVAVAFVANFSAWQGELHVGPVALYGEQATGEQQVTTYGEPRDGTHERQVPAAPGEWTADWRASALYGEGTLRFRLTVEECKPAEEGAG